MSYIKKTTDKYAVAPKTILNSNKAINLETGEVMVILPETKLAYFYAREQYCFFKTKNQTYNESWERIVASVAICADKKRKRISKQLRDLGLVITTKGSNVKEVVDVMDVCGWKFTNEDVVLFDSSFAKDTRAKDKSARMSSWKDKRKESNTWTDRSNVISPINTKPVDVDPFGHDHINYEAFGIEDDFDMDELPF